MGRLSMSSPDNGERSDRAPNLDYKTNELASRLGHPKNPEPANSLPTVVVIVPKDLQPANAVPANVASLGGSSEPAPNIRGVTDT
jgi:hypothetical protein